jgi:hypothetical protein
VFCDVKISISSLRRLVYSIVLRCLSGTKRGLCVSARTFIYPLISVYCSGLVQWVPGFWIELCWRLIGLHTSEYYKNQLNRVSKGFISAPPVRASDQVPETTSPTALSPIYSMSVPIHRSNKPALHPQMSMPSGFPDHDNAKDSCLIFPGHPKKRNEMDQKNEDKILDRMQAGRIFAPIYSLLSPVPEAAS